VVKAYHTGTSNSRLVFARSLAWHNNYSNILGWVCFGGWRLNFRGQDGRQKQKQKPPYHTLLLAIFIIYLFY
jgi:hypothetical protein